MQFSWLGFLCQCVEIAFDQVAFLLAWFDHRAFAGYGSLAVPVVLHFSPPPWLVVRSPLQMVSAGMKVQVFTFMYVAYLPILLASTWCSAMACFNSCGARGVPSMAPTRVFPGCVNTD